MELSHVRGGDQPPLPQETIGRALARAAASRGEREALVACEQDLRLTYAELLEAVDEVARGLLARGVGRGDRVGIWSPNRAEWTLVQYATARIGAILVTINPAYRSSELRYALDQSGCRTLIAARSFKSSDYVAILAEVRDQLPELTDVVWLDDPSWQALLDGGRDQDPAAVERAGEPLTADDPINIQYTSGTTGFPKGATLTHRNILGNGYLVGNGCRYGEQDRICVPVPFYHCFGMVMGNLAALAHGACVVIPAQAFDPAATLRAAAAERCTSLYGVPTMFIAMLADPSFDEHDLSTLRTGIMAGSPCPAEVMRQVIDRMHMGEVTICYGMTETSPVSTQTAADDPLEQRVGTVGRVHPHVEVKVVDPATGETVPRGETGELCTRGYSVMRGYWNDPGKTAEAIDGDGWMHTGDLATIDEQGYLRIVGRSKDMIIRGGENVYPREIEEFLYTHPDVADVQVIGVPDERFGEEIMAWVIPRAGVALDGERIREFCRGTIAHYKVPRYVHVTDEFPMTVTGKVQKYLMREQAIEQLGLGATANG
ncbi:Acetoacetyl-CoA synthetase [Patulibacter medicamentivorans]|uniref:Acetoacetyl-CoA synthetase n=1 Tax=Patulibacter medicamentivorans TaxID=1097667 RepID=H0E909_9ACTN|nr:AMP-binding protein [Patulibacter medicamentivorans]EHN09822.1 Acetoacetyl-CoA synthetase [Patulibacter medicamentivorans]